ncbi:unnamed protein product, partial [Brassica rapa subsp. narinosa]
LSFPNLRFYIDLALHLLSSLKLIPSSPNERSNLQSSEKESKAKRRYLEKDKGQSSIERIVLRLRNLGLAASDDDEEDDAEDNEEEDVKKPVTEEERLGDLLKREWVRPDVILAEGEESDDEEDDDVLTLVEFERRTGGMVIWRAGSVMVVYRGRDYQGPSAVFNQMARPEEHYQGPSAGSVLVYSYFWLPSYRMTITLEIMRHMPEHPNVVTLRETYEDEHAVHLGMELCEGVELFDRNVARGHYTERAAAVVTKTIMAVVQFKLVCCSFFLFPCRKTLQRDELGRFVSNKGNESVLKNFWHHTDAIICCSMKAMPVFIFANQAGLDMLETTLVSLQDISLEKIFDDNGRKTLCSEFPQIMQQGFASLQGGICLSSMGRPVSYERAVAWKVLNEEENAHCICFVFINWSFV